MSPKLERLINSLVKSTPKTLTPRAYHEARGSKLQRSTKR